MKLEPVTDAELTSVEGGAVLVAAFAAGYLAGTLVGIYAGERGSITDAARAGVERAQRGL